MPSLTDLFNSVPFYGAYNARTEQNRQRGVQDLQEAGTVMALKEKVLAQRADQEMRQLLAQSGGDVNKAMAAAMQSGNAGVMRALAPVFESQRKANTSRIVPPGGALLGPNNEVVHQQPFAPKEQSLPEIVKLQNFLRDNGDKIPPQARAQIEAKIKLLSEGRPQTVINMPGSSDTVQGPDGKFYKFRLGKDGQVEVVPMQTPGGVPLRPPESPQAGRDRAKDADQEATLTSVRERIASMTQKLQQNTGVVGPLGIARRTAEAVGGMAAPDMPTPAIDYQNEMRLLVADVRKIVEKDTNLSNEERKNMHELLGAGTFQTPGSAFRTLNNVLGVIENKRMTGLGRQAGLESAVRAAGWAYEPAKYDYRVVNGQVQRKAKGQ